MEIQEIVSYIVLIIGVAIDQISTRIVSAYSHIYEVNPFARWLQANGLWLISDVSICILIILPLSIILQEKTLKGRHTLILAPMVVGFLRLILGISNLLLI